ncbi:MAG: hypothetical protein CL681_22360, partial [Blastopirellula sp.]|nr:hypothetical protein [Blastopirellula sp.]
MKIEIKPCYRLLDLSSIYNAVQKILGESKAREKFVTQYVKPNSGDRILDIGCGTARILEHLPLDIDYVGFDQNVNYISEAKRRYGSRGKFYLAEIDDSSLGVEGKFDIVLANGVMHHLEDSDLESFTRLARLALKPDGRLITIDGVYVDEQNPIARYLISIDRGKYVRDAKGYEVFFIDQENKW